MLIKKTKSNKYTGGWQLYVYLLLELFVEIWRGSNVRFGRSFWELGARDTALNASPGLHSDQEGDNDNGKK